MAEEKNTKSEELEEYRKVVESAAKNNIDLPIPNEDTEHAKILYQVMLPEAKAFVHIFTGNFRKEFYEDFEKEFESINKGKVAVEVLSTKDVPKEIKSKFPGVKFSRVNTKFKNHFMVIDDRTYRFEKPHNEKEKNVEAVANFNDPEIARRLNQAFDMIKAA